MVRGEQERNNPHQQPHLIPIGERAEAIVRAFEERQITTQEILRQLLEGPVREAKEAEEARKRSNMSPEAFAVFWVLKREGVDQSEETALRIAIELESHPHWQTSDEHEREVRKAAYKALLDAGVEEVVALADRLLRMLRRGD